MCELSLCLSFRRRRQTFAKIAKILVRAKHTHQMLKLRRYVCNVMCRVINAIQCQVWFSSLKLKGYHVVTSCALSCTFFVQSKSTQCHVSLLARANVPLSTNRYHGGWWEKHFSEIFPVFESTRAAVLSMIIRSACALLLCLFSRIMSLRVF